jgi:Fe-S-cluster-containing hydrogenase component 2
MRVIFGIERGYWLEIGVYNDCQLRKIEMDNLNTKAIVDVIEDQCKGCEICVLVCPNGCLFTDIETFNANGFHPVRFRYGGTKGKA